MTECPKILKADDELRDKSYEDRLKSFEEEAISLYEFCLKKGFTDGEVKTCVSKLYGPPKSTSSKAIEDSKRSLIHLAVIIALIGIVYASPEANNFVAAHYKIFTIKV